MIMITMMMMMMMIFFCFLEPKKKNKNVKKNVIHEELERGINIKKELQKHLLTLPYIS